MRPALAASRSWISGSGSARPSAGSSSTSASSGTSEAERARELAGDDLGDERLAALAGAAELEDVEAVVARLDERGQRAALAERRDVARGLDPLELHARRAYRGIRSWNLPRAG